MSTLITAAIAGEIIHEDHATGFEMISTGSPIATTSDFVSCPSLSKADNVTVSRFG